MEGHIVQAPNSLLNTLFILNQRRSNSLADPIELKVRFGTPSSLIEELKSRMTAFVMENKRDYASRILTEVRSIDEVWSVTINFIFFHKTNYQNELLRLTRHNKFAAELMRQMSELGIEGPRRTDPGGSRLYPLYWATVHPPAHEQAGTVGGSGIGRSASTSGSAASVASETASAVLARRRPDSRIISDVPDFGDVYDSRRGEHPSHLARLASVRETTPSPPQHTSTNLDKVQSSRVRGLFGARPRSNSNAPGPSNLV
jgi:hypothetical protein